MNQPQKPATRAVTTRYFGRPVGPTGYGHGVAKARSQYRCSECHHATAKWVGRCPDCGTWGTVDEVAVLSAVNGAATRRAVAPTSPAVPISAGEAPRREAAAEGGDTGGHH